VLVAGPDGSAVRGVGPAYERDVEVIDTSSMNGGFHFQINIGNSDGYNVYFPTYSDCPRTLHLLEGTSGNKADYVADAPGAVCTAVGTWDLVQSDIDATGAFEFDNNGTFYGGAAGAKLPDENTFGGRYNVQTDTFTLESSYGMTCGQSATYKLSFSSSCKEMSLHEITDNCTGARKYLHVDQTLRRR